MKLIVEAEEVRALVADVFHQALEALDWPKERICLTESEAAAACGVSPHVLRDLRQAGHITHSRLGRRIVYLRQDLLAVLGSFRRNERGGK